MGLIIHCLAEYNGESSEGDARLEPDALYFKGQFRLKIPIDQVQSVQAKRGRLEVEYDGGSASFNLGPMAEKWMLKIRYPRPLLDKLGVKAESKVVVLGVEDESFWEQLRGRVRKVSKSASSKYADVVFFLAEAKEALIRLKSLEGMIVRNGVIWVIAPKGKQHIKESDVLAAGASAGLVDTKVVSFSDTHTAHKFVIPVGRR
jgi:hypothetical protein